MLTKATHLTKGSFLASETIPAQVIASGSLRLGVLIAVSGEALALRLYYFFRRHLTMPGIHIPNLSFNQAGSN